MKRKKENQAGAYIGTPVVVIVGPYTGKTGRITRVFAHVFSTDYIVSFDAGVKYDSFKLWMLRTPDGKKLKAV